MSITPERAAQALMARAAQEQAEVAERQARIERQLPSVAAMLRDRHGATRVILFGSFAWGGVHRQSDVDLAVSGLSYAQRLDAMTEASALLSAVVEIFGLDDLPESFRHRVLAEGLALP